MQRPGVRYTDRALSLLDPAIHQVRTATIFGSRDGAFTPLPDSLMLRDGTSIVVGPTPEQLDPYVVDSIDGRLLLLDGGEPLEEVEYWFRPALLVRREVADGAPFALEVVMLASHPSLWKSGVLDLLEPIELPDRAALPVDLNEIDLILVCYFRIPNSRASKDLTARQKLIGKALQSLSELNFVAHRVDE